MTKGHEEEEQDDEGKGEMRGVGITKDIQTAADI